jgi:hypothetical protein
MCLMIDKRIKSLSQRTVWKVFDQDICRGHKRVVSLFAGTEYPKGKLVTRSEGPRSERNYRGDLIGTHGLHFYRTEAIARSVAKTWFNVYIAKCAVDPKDFMFASLDGREAMYERATRVGNFIKVTRAG